jgi:hypothetical protein
MAYRIATNGDNVEFDNGPLSGYTMGGYTAAAFAKRNTLGGRQGAIFIVNSGFSFPHFEFGFESSNAALLTASVPAAATVTGPTLNSTSLWYLVVVTGSGSATPRFHVHNGTSWSHSNGSTAFNSPTIGATDRVFLSPSSGWGGEYLKADVVCAGFKKSDSTDSTVETLTPLAFSTWVAFGFDWLIGFDASSSRVNQGSGSGGNETARTGTSLVSDPAGWSWAIPATFVPQIIGVI